MPRADPRPGTKVKRSLLRAWPLPVPQADGDKKDRGTVLAIGGSPEVPGALLLSGVAALRAGAGRLRLGTEKSVTAALGVAVPEASVVALPAGTSGALGQAAGFRAARLAKEASVVLFGPGVMDPKATMRFLDAFLKTTRKAPLVLDAVALAALDHRHRPLTAVAPCVLTPHSGELAAMTEVERDVIDAAPAQHAVEAAATFGAVVVLKGPETWIASADGELYRYSGGSVGLATSGSGDVLAGLVAGLVARGTDALQAAVWAVYLHGEAGNALVKRGGLVGLLARELAGEVPRLMRDLAR